MQKALPMHIRRYTVTIRTKSGERREIPVVAFNVDTAKQAVLKQHRDTDLVLTIFNQ